MARGHKLRRFLKDMLLAGLVLLLVAGFVMIFFVQVAGNAMQIFASEVFPTNARASGFGWASGVGRLATAFILPSIVLVQATYGLTTVFACLAVLLIIAAGAVTQLGPEAKQLGLDEIAPPTQRFVKADSAFWLKFAGFVTLLVTVAWWLYFYLAAKELSTTFVCLVYSNVRCDTLVAAAQQAGKDVLQLDAAGRPGLGEAKAWAVERGLRVESIVHQPDDDLHMALRLHVAAHHAKRGIQ